MGRRPLPAAVRLRVRPGRRDAGAAGGVPGRGRARPGLRHRRAGGPDRRRRRPGGRGVAEMGGAGNIQAILDAVGAAMAEAGLPQPASPWYFPTPARQAALLEAAGFRVARMEYFPRPTPLEGCPNGLADWLEM